MQNIETAIGNAEAILNSITDAFYFLDREWRFAYVNRRASELLDRQPQELLGKTIWDEYPLLIGTDLEKTYRKVAAEKTNESVTFFYPEHQRWYEVHCNPVPQGISVYFRDATTRVLAGERLRESEVHFRTMANAIPQIVWITDAEGNVQFFNQQWYDYTGNRHELEDAGQVSADYVHPEDHASTMTAWENAKRDGKTYLIEHRIRSAAGQYRWFLVRGEPYHDPMTGNVIRWYGTSTDIHDKRLAEAALRQSEERYRTLVTASAQMVWRAEPNGEIFADSPSWRAYTGQSYDEWKGFGWTSALHPEDTQRIMPIWQQCLIERKICEVEYRVRRVDGEYRWTAVRAVPVLNADNSVREWIGTNTDIHEVKLAATELEASQERLKLATEGGKVGIWDWDMVAGKVDWSRQVYDIHGLSPDDFGGTAEDFKRTVHPDDLPELWHIIEEALQDKDVFARDFRIVRPDGSIRWVSNWGNIYRNDDHVAVRVVGTLVDITDRKNAEFALQEQNRRKDEFLAMLAHELRNPLAPISAAAALMGMIQPDAGQLKQTSEIINRQVQHMTGMIDDLMDVSRVTRGLVALEKRELSVKRVIYDAVEQVGPLIRTKRHHLSMELAPEPAIVLGDEKRLVQILTNLLNNAAKYTPDEGTLQLRMDVQDGSVLLSVVDNGIGIAPELQPHIFDLFIQAERSPDRSQGGLGLGLALVKSLVELHHGTITCASAGAGLGSVFTIRLPRVALKDDRKNSFYQNQADGLQTKRKLRILVVDDNMDAAQMQSLYLQAAGHEVATEYGSKQALMRAKVEKPDLCMLDIGLPEMDGNELARQLRQHPETKQIWLIAITGYGQEHDRRASLDAGFDYHLVKPVNASELITLIGQLDEGRKRH
ncbi:PAS domain-containing hybrid sensor histidine kinase/response regulator [Noviherbaspirillum aerium]|uniref:PAS domain-containing hybrid sensor histidine kinase/response regulator n=1 Tax=Noviherbaspirillum aerium TaxID=2588497 RepID=UPI00124C40AE|nr:PAS domain-containing protein [Noviherbaspirillum aerium]